MTEGTPSPGGDQPGWQDRRKRILARTSGGDALIHRVDLQVEAQQAEETRRAAEAVERVSGSGKQPDRAIRPPETKPPAGDYPPGTTDRARAAIDEARARIEDEASMQGLARAVAADDAAERAAYDELNQGLLRQRLDDEAAHAQGQQPAED